MDMELLYGALPIIISVVLFIVTWIIILILRAEDKKDSSFTKVQMLADRRNNELSQASERIRQESIDAADRIAAKIGEADAMIAKINRQFDLLMAHSEDLAELQRVMDYYRQVLQQLSSMTEQAEQKTLHVKEEILQIQQVHSTIDAFSRSIADAQTEMDGLREHASQAVQEATTSIDDLGVTFKDLEQRTLADIGDHRQTLLDIRKETEQQLQASADTCRKDAKAQLQALCDASMHDTDIAFQTMIRTVQSFLLELNARTQANERLCTQLLADSSTSLDGASRQLAQQAQQLQLSEATLQELQRQRDEATHAIEALGKQQHELQRQRDEATHAIEALDKQQDELQQQVQATQGQLEELQQQAKAAQHPQEPAVSPVPEEIVPIETEPEPEVLPSEEPSPFDEADELEQQELLEEVGAYALQDLMEDEDEVEEPELQDAEEAEEPEQQDADEAEEPEHQDGRHVAYVPDGEEETISLDDEEEDDDKPTDC